MKTKQGIKQLNAMMELYAPTGKNADVMVIGAIMDEIGGTKAEGTSDKIVERLHKRTGYTFPESEELKQLFSQ